jgi:hypothetical protein
MTARSQHLSPYIYRKYRIMVNGHAASPGNARMFHAEPVP